MPPDFSTGTFHNRSAHKSSIHEQARGARGRRGLSPLSTARPAGRRGEAGAHSLGPVAAGPIRSLAQNALSPGAGMDEELPLAPKVVKLIPSRERVSGAVHLRRFRG